MIQDHLQGYDQLGQNLVTQMTTGYVEHELLDASGGDVEPSTVLNCRAIKIDGAGIIKIDYIKQDGETVTEVMYLPAGIIHAVRNVTKLYRYYTGTTAGTATCYDASDDGASVTNAVKLLR